ncbi:acyl-CoA thioesterase [Paraburkholderia sp. GAS334]|uniref:acyl-CoA thioesterase n=1 Tax=Paraburkholderia sp. GAS334 TaxID=3035131 RepID=UPI003D260E08
MNMLNAELVELHGIEPGWRFGLSFDVRWSELDAFAHVSHRSYFTWCEEARNAYFASLGEPAFSVDAAGPVLKDVGFTYERSLDQSSQVVVTARVAWVRNTSFRMEFAAWSRELVGRGHAICIWMRNSTGELVALPDDLRCRIAQRDEPQDLRGVK